MKTKNLLKKIDDIMFKFTIFYTCTQRGFICFSMAYTFTHKCKLEVFYIIINIIVNYLSKIAPFSYYQNTKQVFNGLVFQ